MLIRQGKLIGRHWKRTMENEGWTGKAGEPVPLVDPSDIRVVWEYQHEVAASLPGKHVVIDRNNYKSRCSVGANVSAITYRTAFLKVTISLSPEVAAHVIVGQPDNRLFRAIAEIPMEWIGTEERKGLPFDKEDFTARLRDEQI